jgi:Concanavalin A-like lectin/glucanases superfamily
MITNARPWSSRSLLGLSLALVGALFSSCASPESAGGGTGGKIGTGGAPGSGGVDGSGGTTGSGGAGTGGAGTGGAGTGGAGTGGSAVGGAGGRAAGGAGGTAGGAAVGGRGAGGGIVGGGGATSCAGRAIAFNANVAANGDPAMARVMVNFGNPAVDLPLGNTARTIEFWAFVRTTSWVADANTIFEYGVVAANQGFGLDFGNPMTVPASIDPYTNGTYDNDNQSSGLSAAMDQWVHFAMTWDGSTAVRAYVNGVLRATRTAAQAGTAMLATAQSQLTIGGNPRGAYFNGYIDEFRIWNVAHSATEIMTTMNRTLAGTEAGLVGYWKFDETMGTSAADSAMPAGHVAHAGTLMSNNAANLPVFIPSTAPINCP